MKSRCGRTAILTGFVLVIPILCTGCGVYYVSRSLSDDSRYEIVASQAIDVIRYKRQFFMLTTPKTPGGGFLIPVLTKSSDLPTGSEYVDAHKIPNPAVKLQQEVIEGLVLKNPGLKLRLRPNSLPDPIDSPAALSKFGKYYVLEIGVPFVFLTYEPLHWETYDMKVQATVRLVRVKDHSIIWSQSCSYGPGDNPGLVLNLRELTDSDAARVKQALSAAVSGCAKRLVSGF